MFEGRKTELIVFVGEPGTGKSTQLKKLIAGNHRNLILPSNTLDDTFRGPQFTMVTPQSRWVPDPDDYRKNKRQIKAWSVQNMNKFQGNKVVNLSVFRTAKDKSTFFHSICETGNMFTNGGLFIDDFKGYIPVKGDLNYSVAEMFRQRRHRMIDIFMACHDFQDINAQVYSFGAKLIIFGTKLPPYGAVKDKIHNFDELMETVSRVNKVVNSADSSNPKDPRRYYHELFTPSVTSA